MPVLPLIDLLILLAWTGLMWAFVHKALWLALATRFTVLGLTPYDFLLGAGVLLLFALSLAARVWVKAHEPSLTRGRSPRTSRSRAEALGEPLEPHGAGGAPHRTAPDPAAVPGSGTGRAATG